MERSPHDPLAVEAARARIRAAGHPEIPARLLRSICVEPRLLTILALTAGPLTVDDLADVIGRAPPATSQHLRVLREAGLVEGVRRGRLVLYRLRDDPTVARLRHALEILADR